MNLIPSSLTSAHSAGTYIKDGSTATFVADVIEASRHVPVLVDFWATWCGPCKTLGPLLEKAVNDAKGAVRLVKVDIDRHQDLARQLQIQSVPTVYAFYQGQVMDGFTGALPESQIKTFIHRVIQMTGGKPDNQQDDKDLLLHRAKEAFDQGDMVEAQAIYNQLLTISPEEPLAYAGLGQIMIMEGHSKEAQAMLDQASPTLKKHPAIISLQAQLDLSRSTADQGATAELEMTLNKNPQDHNTRFDLAMAYYADGLRAEAVNQLLEIVRRDRQWNDQAARKQLLKLFDAFGPSDPATLDGRRRLSSILFS